MLFSFLHWGKGVGGSERWCDKVNRDCFICQVYDSNNINKIPKRCFIKDGSKIMEKTIDFEHKTNGNKACFNASQKIKHYQIDPKKEHGPLQESSSFNPSISWRGDKFFKNGNKKVTMDNSNISKNVTNKPSQVTN